MKKHCWNSENFDAESNDRKIFFVLVSETKIFQCSFSDDSLMIPWGNLDGTTKTLMPAIITIYVPNMLICETLLFRCFFIDDSLRFFVEIFVKQRRCRCKHYLLLSLLMCYFSRHWCFIAPSLRNQWGFSEEKLIRQRK